MPVPMPRVGETLAPTRRAGDVRDIHGDSSKSQDMLGYGPTVDLEERLRKTVE
jgi:hypothetical protein